MTRTEMCIWRAETRIDVERKHPKWNEYEVTHYIDILQELAFGGHGDKVKMYLAYDLCQYLNK